MTIKIYDSYEKVLTIEMKSNNKHSIAMMMMLVIILDDS